MDDRITEPQAKFSSQSQRQHSREIRAHTAELRTHRGMEQRVCNQTLPGKQGAGIAGASQTSL